jgi:hypothetical protein
MVTVFDDDVTDDTQVVVSLTLLHDGFSQPPPDESNTEIPVKLTVCVGGNLLQSSML